MAGNVSWEELKAAIDANLKRNTTLTSGAASASIHTIPDEITLDWCPGWTTDSAIILDAISLSLWIREPLYRTAAIPVRKAMEMEEASSLLHTIDDAWKAHKGCGWIRKHLEEDLRMRAAGGEPSADWGAVRTQRRAAFLVDYVATVRSLRFGLWWPEQQVVTMIPLSTSDTIRDSVQIDCTSGHVLLSKDGFRIKNNVWPGFVKASSCKWIPPASAPSIGTNTVSQIHEKLSVVMPGVSYSGPRQNLWNSLLMETMFKDMM
jgi:hypothetical protein